MYGSQLMIALAVEYKLGRQDSLPILRLALESIGHLYKYQNIADFSGYPIRWDAVTSDKWATRTVKNDDIPWYCCEFLLNSNYEYLYCTPSNHPGYDKTDDANLDRLRYWEPSTDELTGLVLTYDMVFQLVDDAALRTEIRRQVTNLSAYLAGHSYLLVRPCGGFASQGASGVLPAMEYPFSRVFARIIGQDPPAARSFEDALVAAGVWNCVGPSMQRWGVIGIPASAGLFGVLGWIIGAASVALFGFASTVAGLLSAIGAALGLSFGYFLGRAFGMMQAMDCIDIRRAHGAADPREFALAYLLTLIPPKERFKLWMWGIDLGMGGYARGFPQFVCLTALADTTDTTVRDAFLAQTPDPATTEARGSGRNTGFAAAVAVALGKASEEPNLIKFLEDAFDSFPKGKLRQPLLEDDQEHDGTSVVWERIRKFTEEPLSALEYLACLALSWLRAEQLQKDGVTDVAGRVVPLPPGTAPWPRPSVPHAVLKGGVAPALDDVRASGRESVDVFPARDTAGMVSSRPAEPPPPDSKITGIDRYTIPVPESSPLVDWNVDIRLGDSVDVRASGAIKSGVWLTGWNDPDGWNYISNDPKFPLPGTNPYCLLYKIVPTGRTPSERPWKKLGKTPLSFAAMPEDLTGRLMFRTNDDTPGNGDGAFSVDLVIRRAS
jgi:hypothetical protein